jgi:hypothetical protein
MILEFVLNFQIMNDSKICLSLLRCADALLAMTDFMPVIRNLK